MLDQGFATVGDNCIDRFLPPVNDCLVGGNAVNVAVQLARRGRRVDYFGAVGDDAEGTAVRAALAASGVGLAALRRAHGAVTATTDIATLPDGDRRFVAEDFGACLGYHPDAADILRLKSMRHVHVGWLRGAVALRRALAGGGVVVSQDLSVNNRPEDLDPAGLDIAFSSSTAEGGAAESERLLAAGARLAVVTLGAAGSLVNDRGKILMWPGVPVASVDTTGAGDAFIAGFLDAYDKQLNLLDCLASGGDAGRRTCQHRGGFPQLPLQAFVHDSHGARERVLDRD